MVLVREEIGQILVLRINREEALGALSQELLGDLENAFALMAGAGRGSKVRAIILTGTGRAFCTGADLKERATMSPEQIDSFLGRVRTLFSKIENLPCPVICAINGFAFGGGLEIALACDFRIASEDATLGLTETSLGIIPGAGGTQRLTRLIGAARSKLLILTAKKVKADEALSLGVLDRVVPASSLLDSALALGNEIAKNAPIAVAQAKFAINAAVDSDLEAGLTIERNAYGVTIPTKDRVEALNAFKEKRPPVFRGE